MPTYEYACDACGLFDVFQSMSEDAYKRCPHCKGRKIQRVISGGAGVIFKGDGFWETDYNRSGDYKSKAKKDNEMASQSTESSSTSSESHTSSEHSEKKGSGKQSADASLKPQSQAKPKKADKKSSQPKGGSESE